MGGWEPVEAERIRVLHVDDDESLLDLTAQFLERLDDRFEVTTAVGAPAGLDVLETQTVDCIVSDYDMPELDGIEFLHRVRETDPNVPFVLFTGEGSESVASEAIASGATDYVQKERGTGQYEVLSNRVSNAVAAERTERALRRTAEHFERLASAAPVPIAVVDADGHLRYVNDAARSFVEADTPADVLGEEPTAFVHPDDREEVKRTVRRVLADRETPDPLETRFVLPTGERKHGVVTCAPVEYDGERAAQVVVNDLTAERAAKSELERQEAFTGSLLDTVDAAYFVFEVGEGLVRWNDRTADVTGYDDDALAGMLPSEFVPEAYGEERIAAFEQAKCERVRFDGAIETRDGTVLPHEFHVTSYEAQGQRYRVAIAQDISERVERERVLRERKDQLETIVQNFPVILFAVDEDGVFSRSAGAALSDIGLEPGEAEGHSIYEMYPDRDDVHAIFDRAFDGHAIRETMPVGDRLFESFFQPVEDEDGEVTQVVGAAFDVTDRIEQREELEAKNERLDAFASVVSHDLRNPLGVASGAFDIVVDALQATVDAENDGVEGDDDGANAVEEDVLEYVETVRSAHDRMNRIVDDVLALAHGPDDLDERPVDGGAVVQDATANVPLGDVAVDVAYDENVLADRGSLQRLVENLLRNATEHGGREVVVGGLDDDPGFYVADDGAGIPAEARESVLEAGVSTARDGIGLGLAIVRDVATAHGWTVTIAADPDLGGARIEIRSVESA